MTHKMKKILISIYKKLTLKMIAIITLVAVNVYLLTYPSKVLGKIIDLLSNIDLNKELIINHIIALLGASILMLIIRIVWKYLLAITTRQVEKDLRDNLFEHFLKIKLASIQNIKNGELMSYFVKDISEIRGVTYRALSHASRVFFIFVITKCEKENLLSAAKVLSESFTGEKTTEVAEFNEKEVELVVDPKCVRGENLDYEIFSSFCVIFFFTV